MATANTGPNFPRCSFQAPNLKWQASFFLLWAFYCFQSLQLILLFLLFFFFFACMTWPQPCSPAHRGCEKTTEANILTVVILSQLVLRRQKSSYNYLLALAAADILVLLLIVFVDFILEDFILASFLPPSINNAVQVLEFSSIHTSIWITVPLTIDRYIAVCHPLRYHTVSYPARTRKVIFAVYVGCLLSAAPYYWWPEFWHSLPGVGKSDERGGGGGGESSRRTVAEHVLVWAHCATVYLLPCTVFFSLNTGIVRKLRKRRNCFRLRGYSTGKTTAILLAITSVFAILWAPRTVLILYHFYSPPPTSQSAGRLLHVLTDVANMLALLNTGVNFFLYCFISKRFRAMATNMLRALIHCRKQPKPFYASHNFSITSSPWISPANSHCIKMLVYQYDKNGKPICISS
ncbi:probable G-protein coupled receptor 139 isoform X1 [Gambusia affinis]|uniref:probable G-protein coupled receptor 139 isoform X1 n=1 Tax=Gambusia affinis TaxID=33528 RepID=UPI001CDB494B|nr:probable G-protein coupled receptor 139 isoform X1 [Gambusia affinis]